MYYINLKTPAHGTETIDEFTTRKEAVAMLREYRMSIPGAYLSTRCTKEWRNKG